MTLPHEEVYTLKRTRRFLNELAMNGWRWQYFAKLAISKKAREQFRLRIRSCTRHYPFDFHIDQRWSDDVCVNCGDSKQWCKCDAED